MMRKLAVCCTALACLVAGTAGALAQQPDPVVAVVNGVKITQSEVLMVQRTLPAQFQQLPIEVLFPAVLERLIDAKLIVAAARRDRLQSDPDVRRRVEQFEERVVQETYLDRKVAEGMTDSALRAKYDKFVKENPPREEVSARHILVATEAEARQVINDVRRGGDFGAIARAKSMDPAGKQNGGDLGYFGREEMEAEFSDAAFKLKEGQVTDVPIRTRYGWHVIKVEGRRQQVRSFDDMRETLVAELAQEMMNDVVSKLRNGAKIERFNLDGTARAPEAAPQAAPRGTNR